METLRYHVDCVVRSTHSTSPVSSQSTVDIDVSKSAVTPGVVDPGFDNPPIDLSSLVQATTPHSGMYASCQLHRLSSQIKVTALLQASSVSVLPSWFS